MQWFGGLYPVLLPAPPEGCLVDAEDFGRLLQRSGGSQNAADMFLLDLSQAHQIPYGRSGLRTGEGPRKILDADPVRATEDGGAFDDVAQFPEVPRPRVPFH